MTKINFDLAAGNNCIYSENGQTSHIRWGIGRFDSAGEEYALRSRLFRCRDFFNEVVLSTGLAETLRVYYLHVEPDLLINGARASMVIAHNNMDSLEHNIKQIMNPLEQEGDLYLSQLECDVVFSEKLGKEHILSSDIPYGDYELALLHFDTRWLTTTSVFSIYTQVIRMLSYGEHCSESGDLRSKLYECMRDLAPGYHDYNAVDHVEVLFPALCRGIKHNPFSGSHLNDECEITYSDQRLSAESETECYDMCEIHEECGWFSTYVGESHLTLPQLEYLRTIVAEFGDK